MSTKLLDVQELQGLDQYSNYLRVTGMMSVQGELSTQLQEPQRDSSYPIGFVLDDRKVDAFVV